MFDIGRQVAAIDGNQDVRAALAPTDGVIGQPATQDQRSTGIHRRNSHGDGLLPASIGIDVHRAGMATE